MRILFATIVSSLMVASAVAEEAIVAEIEEDFAPSVSVSGNLFVGLSRGPVEGATELGALRIPNFSSEAQNGCLVAKTRDGQFWARSKFELPGSIDATFAFEPDSGWQHAAELANYQLSDFAIIIRAGDDCLLDSEAAAIPARFAQGKNEQISLMVNSQRAISAQAKLTMASGEVSSAVCGKPQLSNVRSTAFDRTCIFDVDSNLSGSGEIELSRRMRTGPRTDRIAVFFPAGDAGVR